jgi:hypothetical protein
MVSSTFATSTVPFYINRIAIEYSHNNNNDNNNNNINININTPSTIKKSSLPLSPLWMTASFGA